MNTLYLAKLDGNGFVKSVAQQDATHYNLLQPADSMPITYMQYNTLFENLGTGRKFKIVEGDIVSVENLNSIKQKYAYSVARLVENAKERGIFFNGLRFKLNTETTHLLALHCPELNFRIKDVNNEVVSLDSSEARELKLTVARAIIDIITSEHDALKAIIASKCSENIIRIFYVLEETMRCINER